MLPLLLAATACGDDGDVSFADPDTGAATGGIGGDGDGEAGWGDEGGSGTGAGDDGGWGGDGDGDGGDPGDGDGDGHGDEMIPAGQLTAGEWRDLDHWAFWRDLFDGDEAAWSEMEGKWGFHTSNRFPIVVLAGNTPVVDVPVTLLDGQGESLWTARTDAHGRAELFDGLFHDGNASESVTVEVDLGGQTLEVDDPVAAGDDPNVVQVDEAPAASTTLDLMFVIDTTGSMGDELHYLQAELGDVIEQVQVMNGQDVSLRVSVNFYRDEGDEYVVKSFPFTHPAMAVGQLEAQDFDGGGDYPEALDTALQDGIFGHQWSSAARSRLLFLVADAPPHAEYQDTVGDLQASARAAAEQGIRVIPVAASGIDKDTEFLMRLLDVSTGGTYIFLTDDSGIGGGHLAPTIGEYDVELLNELLVRVIDESLGE